MTKPTTRKFGEQIFTCYISGIWVSEDGRYAVVRPDPKVQQWRVYHSASDGGPKEVISEGLTMSEAVSKALGIDQNEIYRRHGVGSSE